MKRRVHKKTWLIFAGPIMVFSFAFLPVEYLPEEGNLQFSNAFCRETGTCCAEYNSICNAGGDDYIRHYYKESGSCKTVE